MQVLSRETPTNSTGSATYNRRMLLISIMPMSVILLIAIVWLLLHLEVWCLCTGTVASATSTQHSLLLAISMLTGVFVCFEWWYERAQLGLRDLKRSCIYVVAILVSASMVFLFA